MHGYCMISLAEKVHHGCMNRKGNYLSTHGISLLFLHPVLELAYCHETPNGMYNDAILE